MGNNDGAMGGGMAERSQSGSVLISKTTNFMSKGGNEREDRLEGECWMKCSRNRKETRDNNDGVSMVTESPLFLVKGKNLVVREVSSRFTSTCSTKKTKDRPTLVLDTLCVLNNVDYTCSHVT